MELMISYSCLAPDTHATHSYHRRPCGMPMSPLDGVIIIVEEEAPSS
jgi:hypothetical protein